MIFQLHQRSEEIRSHLAKIDHILLTSRSVAVLTDRAIRVLEQEFDLVSARILFREDHPVAASLNWASPSGAATIPPEFLANESLIVADPFVLDDPSGDLAHALFGNSASLVLSAAVANLCPEDRELGLLCLGSDDPTRYCCGMNTELIASLADKISLGILNAWHHETAVGQAITTGCDGVYSESFFREFVHKEFDRSWRSQTPFSVMAISWSSPLRHHNPPFEEVAEFFTRNVRSADLLAVGETVRLWLMLPETDLARAELVAQRLTSLFHDHFDDQFHLYFGITSFSRDASVMPVILHHAQRCLEAATAHEATNIVAQAVALPEGSSS